MAAATRRVVLVDADALRAASSASAPNELGLLVGRSALGGTRDVILSFAPTPLDTDAGASLDEESCSLLASHALQLSKMLPGGVSVIGMYVCAPAAVVSSPAMRTCLTELDEALVDAGEEPDQERVVVHFDAAKKAAARAMAWSAASAADAPRSRDMREQKALCADVRAFSCALPLTVAAQAEGKDGIEALHVLADAAQRAAAAHTFVDARGGVVGVAAPPAPTGGAGGKASGKKKGGGGGGGGSGGTALDAYPDALPHVHRITALSPLSRPSLGSRVRAMGTLGLVGVVLGGLEPPCAVRMALIDDARRTIRHRIQVLEEEEEGDVKKSAKVLQAARRALLVRADTALPLVDYATAAEGGEDVVARWMEAGVVPQGATSDSLLTSLLWLEEAPSRPSALKRTETVPPSTPTKAMPPLGVLIAVIMALIAVVMGLVLKGDLL